jgi:predicted metal-dependent hydrolase
VNFLLFGAKPKPSEQEHSVTLSDRIVPYIIKRSLRRRLSITIDHRGLRVLGPMNLTLRQSESLILTHEQWVIQKLDEWRPERLNSSWSIHGTTPLPIFGVPHEVRTAHHAARSPRIERLENTLLLHTADTHHTARSHKALVKWLRQEALTYFEARIKELATLMDVRVSALSLSQARTRWGSCTSHGHIRLNWRLVHLPQNLVDYVIVHELAHLKEMNHSARFWAVVESVYPDHKSARRALRSRIATLPLIELA